MSRYMERAAAVSNAVRNDEREMLKSFEYTEEAARQATIHGRQDISALCVLLSDLSEQVEQMRRYNAPLSFTQTVVAVAVGMAGARYVPDVFRFLWDVGRFVVAAAREWSPSWSSPFVVVVAFTVLLATIIRVFPIRRRAVAEGTKAYKGEPASSEDAPEEARVG